MAASWAAVKGPAWTGSGESSEENSSMISLRPPADAKLEESSPGSSKFACLVVNSVEAVVNVALTGRLSGAKRFVRARPACGFEVERGDFVPAAKLRREMRAALPPMIGRLSAWRRRRRTSVESEAKSFCFRGRPLETCLRGRAFEKHENCKTLGRLKYSNLAIQLGMRHRTFTRPSIVRVLSQGKQMKNNVVQNRTCT